MMKGHYKYLIISLVMILLIQLLELASPLLVKNVLDEGLSGIEYPWVVVDSFDEKAVEYNNKINLF